MSEPIFDPSYWSDRIAVAKERNEIHQSVFICGGPHWEEIEAYQANIIPQYIQPRETVLDVGCGFGRMAKLITPGNYLGIDLCPGMIEIAEQTYPHHHFLEADIHSLDLPTHGFDWGLVASVRRMVIRYKGAVVWNHIQKELLRVCHRLLVIEYNEAHEDINTSEILVIDH